jgi:hypothetical protein
MVVLTTEKDHQREPLLARKCRSCCEVRWRAEFDNLYTKRCVYCTRKVLSAAHCNACGDPSGLTRDRKPRRYCDKSACQDAKRAEVGKVVSEMAARKMSARRSKVCPVCAKRKPLTDEFWSVGRRTVAGEKRYESYCRSCKAADARVRYATDEQRRTAARARAARHREEMLRRRAEDPEFNAAFLERKRASSAREREVRRLRREEAKRVPAQQPSSGTGPEMPAQPLMVAIDAWIAREEITEVAAADRLGTTDRRFRDWRKGGNTRMSIVDRALSAMDLLWFDVYDPATYPEVEAIWEG